MNLPKLKAPFVLAAVGLGIGFLADLMLYKQPLGISVPVIVLLIWVALFVLAVREGMQIAWGNALLALPLLFFAIMSAVRAEPMLRFINIAGSAALLLLLGGVLAARPLIRFNLGDYVETLITGSVLAWMLPFALISSSQQAFKGSDRPRGQVLRRLGVGLLIAAPFLCIFTLLFASADLVFDLYLTQFIDSLNLSDLIGHAFLTLLLSWVVIGGLIYTLTRRPEAKRIMTYLEPTENVEGDEPAEKPAVRIRGMIGMMETSIVLGSVNVLFLLFVIIQFAALFGGEQFLRSQGLTYSEYARRGFFELLAVSLIVLGLILSLEYLTRRESSRQRVIFLVGNGLMIAMTIVILISAMMRLRLYEVAYGFTTLRLYSHVFMIWLAVLLVFVLVMLVINRPRLFGTGALVFVIGFSATMNLLNPDVTIFRQNLAHAETGEELDVDYLGSLSEDAVPMLIDLYESGDSSMQEQVGPWLRSHYEQLERRQDRAGWFSFHFSISRATRLLDPLADEIQEYDLPEYWGF